MTVLIQRCRDDLTRCARGQAATNAERLERQLPAFLPLPATPFDPSRVVPARVNSLSLVRFDTNDYSVPGPARPSAGHAPGRDRDDPDRMRRPVDRRASSRMGPASDGVRLGPLPEAPGAEARGAGLRPSAQGAELARLLRGPCARRLEEADPQARDPSSSSACCVLHEDFRHEELTAAVQAALRLPTIKAADVRVLLERGREDPATAAESGGPSASEGDPGGSPRPEGVRRTAGRAGRPSHDSETGMSI